VADDKQDCGETGEAKVSRRDFIVRSVAPGLVSAPSLAATLSVVESDVTIQTPDGTCDAAFIHPALGAYPGVIIWTDAAGLRPSMRDIGKRIATEGYSVLVPNPFYRVGRAPMFTTAANVDFRNQDTMAKIRTLMSSINAPGAAEKDATAFVAFLDAQAQVDKSKKMGTRLLHGWPAGGENRGDGSRPHWRRRVVSRRGAGDRQVGQSALARAENQGANVLGIASNDDQRQPDAKDKLRESFARAGVPAEIEVYAARHGWCVPDMPLEDGAPLYDKAEAERAWGKLVTLYEGLS